jgi:hypothetical protein
VNEEKSNDESPTRRQRLLNTARWILPFFPVYALLLPVLLLWLPVLALFLFILLTYAFYPYSSAWNSDLSQQGLPSRLEHGFLISALHWIVIGVLHVTTARKWPARKSIGLWLLLAFVSVSAAYSVLDYFCYEVKVRIDF